jgi:hypothetical protein
MDYKQVKKDTAQSTQPACTANVTTWNSQVQAMKRDEDWTEKKTLISINIYSSSKTFYKNLSSLNFHIKHKHTEE